MMTRLIIAEDEKPLRDKMLNNVDWQANGYLVRLASNGMEALQIMEEQEVDILVTDIQMPRMTGIELAERARKLNRQLRVVIISGYAEFEYIKGSPELGIDEYLLKPFRTQRLLDVANHTREKLKKDKQRRQLVAELSQFVTCSEADRAVGWLMDESFNSTIETTKLQNALLNGGRELNLETERIVQELHKLVGDKCGSRGLLSNVLLATLQLTSELGYSVADVINLLDKTPQELNMDIPNEVGRWLAELLSKVNDLTHSNPSGKTKRRIS